MSDDDLYLSDLPSDPEVAFFKLEAKFREEIKQDDDDNVDDWQIATYIDNVLSARDALGVSYLKEWQRPSYQSTNSALFNSFRRDVDALKTFYRIRNTRRVDRHSVRFDAAAKQKLGHYLTQIRDFITKLELPPERKETFFAKVEALQLEVDRDRTKFESFGALVIEASGALGESAEKLEPLRKWLDSIAKVFWGAKEEEQRKLPAPELPKQIETKRSQK